jgi:chemotaxis-related protein WspB
MASLFAKFQIGSVWYALPVRGIVRILPLAGVRLLPGTPTCFAGVLMYERRPVPVVDLCSLLLGRPAAPHYSSRIILVRPFDPEQDERLLGMIAEKMTNIIGLDERAFVSAGASSEGAAYLGPVASLGDCLLQRVDVRTLLPCAALEALGSEPGMRG